ncbi:MAG: TetR family transcriptional regulator C-terminal domain-containing protein [Methylococcaceae bacterium]
MKNMKQKEINRESLLNEGLTLLMQQGYHGTGLKEILDAVQIPKGSFYNYFGSKENFAVEIVAHYITPYITQLNRYLDESDDDALAALKRYLQEGIDELERTEFKGGCLLGNLIGEVGDTSEVCRVALQMALNRYRDVWEIGLGRAQLEGSIRRDKTARELADFWVNAWQGALLRMKIEQSTAPLKQCREQLLDDFFKA